MTFQAYLDNIEKQTGVPPMIGQARQARASPSPAPRRRRSRLAQGRLQLGHGHAMAIVKLPGAG